MFRKYFIIFAKEELNLKNSEIAFLISKSVSIVRKIITDFNKMSRESNVDIKLFFKEYDEILKTYNNTINI